MLINTKNIKSKDLGRYIYNPSCAVINNYNGGWDYAFQTIWEPLENEIPYSTRNWSFRRSLC